MILTFEVCCEAWVGGLVLGKSGAVGALSANAVGFGLGVNLHPSQIVSQIHSTQGITICEGAAVSEIWPIFQGDLWRVGPIGN